MSDHRSSGGIVILAIAQVARGLAWGDVLGVGNNVRNVKIHAVATERTEHGSGLYL